MIAFFYSDIDECKENDHECSEHAVCSNTFGNYTCECTAGYQGMLYGFRIVLIVISKLYINDYNSKYHVALSMTSYEILCIFMVKLPWYLSRIYM